jgi:superfamily II DNA or RNA helicase
LYDRRILQLLIGAPKYSYHSESASEFYPSGKALAELLPLMCATGRCFIANGGCVEDGMRPCAWDEGEPWNLLIGVRQESSKYRLTGSLVRGEELIDLKEPDAISKSGVFSLHGRISRFDEVDCFGWMRLLRREERIEIPVRDRDSLLHELLQIPCLPKLDLPDELQFEAVNPPCCPTLKIRRSSIPAEAGTLYAEFGFEYAGFLVPAADRAAVFADWPNRRRIVRDRHAEEGAIAQLEGTGLRRIFSSKGHVWFLSASSLPRVVRILTAAGWRVEAEGKIFRTAGAFKIEVSSGIDWFELRGTVQFGESSAQLPALLTALKRKENSVLLDDGSVGILPEDWLRKYGVLAGLGTDQGDYLRFNRCQAGLLDALLAAEPAATCDEIFDRVRARLRHFDGVNAADAPPGFQGQLRDYQLDGLGWMHFIREFGFGGCLADDMGLGKTVQVLALLESRRLQREKSKSKEPRASLVVAPRSLIFNWKEEAARFTPQLRVLDHTGVNREKSDGCFQHYDLVLTTYGTLRRDAAFFKDQRFDCLVLDEAQAIKNAGTASAKATRLLKGEQRLALSGTPVENHLGELWSLFEFLNPGMLGASSILKLGQGELRKPDPVARELLAHALRPFILRRTKAQVAKELPEKIEQTIYCELDQAQRRLYNQLRDHYRRELMRKVEREGINKNQIHILEALLRLRQAAIHPGLIDANLRGEPSAKLDALLPHLDEVIEEGHKALVFSQFTSMLAILKPRLQAMKLKYAYLDGATRNRQAEVQRFQEDPDCSLFLISLKAGGLGLNLTAAEYVFLLDPWWNPAVEMQAVDRTHRIGQTRTVFAYRLIARDTVEEKVLDLQNAKRDLAQAIINADNSLIRDLRKEDLELLLS